MPFSETSCLMNHIAAYLMTRGFAFEELREATRLQWRFTKNHYNIIYITAEQAHGNLLLAETTGIVPIAISSLSDWTEFLALHNTTLRKHRRRLQWEMRVAFRKAGFDVIPPPSREMDSDVERYWSLVYSDVNPDHTLYLAVIPTTDGTITFDLHSDWLDMHLFEIEISLKAEWTQFIKLSIMPVIKARLEVEKGGSYVQEDGL